MTHLLASIWSLVTSVGVVVAIVWIARRYVTAGDGNLRAALAEAERRHAARGWSEVKRIERERKSRGRKRESGPVVPIGVATGRLLSANNASGLAAGTVVEIDTETACRGIVVIGPSGSGKGYGVLQPFVGHWLEQDATSGLFAFSDKPNWASILRDIALHVRGERAVIHIVGPGREPWPLLKGLSPDAVAAFVRSAMHLGAESKGDSFFENSAANLVRRVASVLHAATQIGPVEISVESPNGDGATSYTLRYDLESIARICKMGGEEFSQLVVPELRAQGALLEPAHADAKRLLDFNLPDVEAALSSVAEKQREGIKGSIDTVLAPFFTSGEFVEAFSGERDFDLGALDRGEIVILDVDKDAYPDAYRLAFLLAFEQCKLHMRRRITRKQRGERLNAILFVADEYAQVVDRSHAEMWRISRESRIAPLIAYQIHSDLHGKIGRDPADGMMRNMTTRIEFPNDDPASIALVNAGRAEVDRTSKNAGGSKQVGKNSGASTNLAHGGGGNMGSSFGESITEGDSWGETVSKVQLAVVDEQLMESLRNDISEYVPEPERKAEVVVRTVMDGKRVLEVVKVQAWAPRRSGPAGERPNLFRQPA